MIAATLSTQSSDVRTCAAIAEVEETDQADQGRIQDEKNEAENKKFRLGTIRQILPISRICTDFLHTKTHCLPHEPHWSSK
jgi:hypothetical protein